MATVFSPHGARVVRSVAAISGWNATWQPRRGPATPLRVQPDGLVQAVDVPPGLGEVTWSYTPPGFPAGLALSLVAAALVVGFLVLAFLARRPRQPMTHFRASAAGRVNDSYRTGPGALLRDR